MGRSDSEGGVVTVPQRNVRIKHPKHYQVLLINDDYTPMDFVVSVLETIFRKTPSEAVRLMLEVHHQGKAVCGIYSRQIAEAKVTQVREVARAAGHPLQATMEEAASGQ
jgi:ATP-dependent Clp protease adaptor protein ClpS